MNFGADFIQSRGGYCYSCLLQLSAAPVHCSCLLHLCTQQKWYGTSLGVVALSLPVVEKIRLFVETSRNLSQRSVVLRVIDGIIIHLVPGIQQYLVMVCILSCF